MVHIEIARLHADDAFVAREFVHYLWCDGDARAVGNLVDQDRHGRSVGVPHEIVTHSGLRRVGVIRRHHHQCVDARVRECLAGLKRVVKTRIQHAGDHRHLAAHRFDAEARHPDTLLARDRTVLTRAAQRHDAIDAVLEQVRNQRLRSGNVDRVIVIDGGGNRREDPPQSGSVHDFPCGIE